MTYAVPDDVREAVAPDGNTVGTCAELADEQLQRSIQRAQDLVDASTGIGFTDTNVPSLVRGLVIALGSYYATLAYRKSKDLAQFDPVYLQYQDATAILKDIKNGLIDISPPEEIDPGPIGRSRPKVFNSLPQNAALFGLDDLGLVVTPDSRIGPRIEVDEW